MFTPDKVKLGKERDHVASVESISQKKQREKEKTFTG